MNTPFEQSLLPHLDAAYNLARWLLRDEHDARDSVQDACLRAFQARDRFRGGDGRAWLLTIVRNVCYTRLRQVRREKSPEAFDELQHGAVDAAAETAAQARREADHARLDAALAALPEEMREVIVLHELEDLSYKEIATVVGIPLGTVMSRLARARLRLQRELKQPPAPEDSHGLQ
ncbi:MAG: sigma-70 family RNA polymerase sigma factor [Opitutae bacterium]|nr:sigma-70 family RNA polymerase sigma factor [Opitutae bacterium]